jgi:hypothetical protein
MLVQLRGSVHRSWNPMCAYGLNDVERMPFREDHCLQRPGFGRPHIGITWLPRLFL